MRQKLYNYFIGGRNFKKEVKRQIRLLIVITLGFTIAFAWRQTIFDGVQVLVTKIIKFQDPLTSSLLTSIFITLIALIIIYLTSQFLKDKPDNY